MSSLAASIPTHNILSLLLFIPLLLEYADHHLTVCQSSLPFVFLYCIKFQVLFNNILVTVDTIKSTKESSPYKCAGHHLFVPTSCHWLLLSLLIQINYSTSYHSIEF